MSPQVLQSTVIPPEGRRMGDGQGVKGHPEEGRLRLTGPGSGLGPSSCEKDKESQTQSTQGPHWDPTWKKLSLHTLLMLFLGPLRGECVPTIDDSVHWGFSFCLTSCA